MTRRYTSKKDFATMMLAQNGRCQCGTKLEKGNTIIEHSTPLALGGKDVLSNKYLNCKECADRKTYGRSKATSYGSDRHAIDKTKRLRGETKNKPGRRIPSKPFQKRTKPYVWPKRKMRS